MTRPPLTSRSRAARDALAAVILEAFERPDAIGLLDDLTAVLVGAGTVPARGRAARLASSVALVQVGEAGALLPAAGVAPGPLVERLRCARQALATDRTRPRPFPGALGVAAVLLAAGLFFEVHEVLEREWQTLTGERRRFYQGVIQLVVALHHLVHENAGSAVRLFASAREKLGPLEPAFEGVDTSVLLAGSAAWDQAARAGAGWPEALPLPELRPAP